jgi:foldase protein PrsA
VQRSRRKTIALAGVLALVVAGCGGSKSVSSTLPPSLVFEVGGTSVTETQLEQQMALAKASLGTSYPVVGTSSYDQLRAEALSALLRTAEIREGARTLAIKIAPAKVDAAVKSITQTAFPGKTAGTVDRAKLLAELKKTGSSEAVFRGQVELKLLTEAIQKKVAPTASVTDKEIAAEYAKTKSTYVTPAKRDVRHILVKDKATADRLYAQLATSDATFAALAKQYSTDTTSAKKGGDLGVSSKGAFVAAFDKVAFSIKTGVVSKPVKTQFGWHLIEGVTDITPATTRPLDAALKAQIRTQLATRKKQQKLQAWFTILSTGLDSKITYAPGFGSS